MLREDGVDVAACVCRVSVGCRVVGCVEEAAQLCWRIVNVAEGMEMGEAFVDELEEHVLLCVFRA